MPFEIPSSWEWTTIENICSKIGSGSTPKGSNYSSKGILFFRSQNVYNDGVVLEDIKYISEEVHQSMIGTEVLPNDLLLNITGGSLGRCAIVPNKIDRGNVSQHVCILRPVIIKAEYLHIFILSSFFATTMKITGSGREGLPKYNLEKMLLPLPPLEEQTRIIKKLRQWLDWVVTIENNQEKLEETIKQAKSKILDLAIHGKLVPQDPNEEPASALLKRINPNAEITCDNGQYGKCPEGWCLTRLGDISNYGENKNIQVEKIGSKEWILELEDIEKDSANITQILTKYERSINGTRHKFKKGDILYSKLRTYLNKVLIAPKDGYCTSEIMVFNTLEGLSNEYICHVLRSPYFLDYTLLCGYGVKMPRLSTIDACNGLIPIPPLAEQKRIVNAIDKAFNKLDSIMESL